MTPCLNVGRAARYRSTGSCIQSALMVSVNIRMLLFFVAISAVAHLELHSPVVLASYHCFLISTGWCNPRGPVGRKLHLQSIRIANTNPVTKSGARSRWFPFLGWPRVCSDTGQPLLGRFLSSVVVALQRDNRSKAQLQ